MDGKGSLKRNAASYDDLLVGMMQLPAKAKGFIDEKRKEIERTSKNATERCREALGAATNCTQNLLSFPQVAVENATRTIGQTASNCQKNIQNLGGVLQENSEKLHQNVAQLGDILQQSFPWENLQQKGETGMRKSQSSENLLSKYGGLPGEMPALRRKLERQLSEHDAEKEASQIDDLLFKGWLKPQAKPKKDGPRARSSLRDPGRSIAVVTTAALPWMTGTAVNPLLRAAYLADNASRRVTLVIPWLSKVDQAKVFPNGMTFEQPAEQEKYVRSWVEKRTGRPSNFKITFYPGRYSPDMGSILPVGDLTQSIPDHEADVAVLEEPEHLNWYHHGRRWTEKFNHVVGIMHTNYLDYARREEHGDIKEKVLRRLNQWVTRIHCHHVVKLSDAVQPLSRERTEFVHGVSPTFLNVGKQRADAVQEGTGSNEFSKGVYFIGKVLWGKGYTELIDLVSRHSANTGKLTVDVFGSGHDLPQVQKEAEKRKLDMTFFGARDHADASIDEYKVFVNPSTSDVVATTTAEALAMGKFVICADHPSNRFFATFKNCLIYKTPDEFSMCIEKALSTNPEPLSPEEQRRLSWEDATERFLDVTELAPQDKPHGSTAFLENALWAAHNGLTGVEGVRVAVGAGPDTLNAPPRVQDYVPSKAKSSLVHKS